MKYLLISVAIGIIALVILFILSICKISSDCSKQEEQREYEIRKSQDNRQA